MRKISLTAIWIILLFSIISFSYYIFRVNFRYNSNNPFKVISLKPYGTQIKIGLSFRPTDICVLKNYLKRFTIFTDDSGYEKELKSKANNFLDFKKYYKNQEDEMTVIFIGNNQSDAVTVHRYSFGRKMYFLSKNKNNVTRTVISNYHNSYDLPECNKLNSVAKSGISGVDNEQFYLMAED